MGFRERYNTIAKQIYFRMNKTRRSKLFGLVNWLYVYLLKALYSLCLLSAVIALIGKSYYLSFIFLLISIAFIILSNYFSLQREYSLIVILDIIKNRIKEKNFNSIRFRIGEDLYKEIEDYITYEINDSDSNSKKNLWMLLDYLKYFVVYRDFEDQIILNQFEKFIDEIKGVFENRAFSKIPSIVDSDFKIMKSSKDYKRIIEDLEANNKFKEDESIFRMIAELNKKEDFTKKLFSGIITLLDSIDRYKWAVILIVLIVLIVLFLIGKISPEALNSIGNLMPWKK